MRIHPVVIISWVVQYSDQVGRQKKEEVKPIEVGGVESILNKQKVRGVVNYLVQWKRFMAKYDNWKKEEDLKNAKELVVELEGRMNTEARRQEKLDIAE